MSMLLCPIISDSYANARDTDSFFSKADRRILSSWEKQEQPELGNPTLSCTTNLYFGFFFDGTKNNYVQAETGRNHSNVARLYDCFPGQSVPGVLPSYTDWTYNPGRYTHFFKVYVPGVASPFKEISDSGEGIELTRGAAAGYRGEARILWGLVQAINNVHRYFYKRPLVSSEETRSLLYRMELNRRQRGEMLRTRGIGLGGRKTDDGEKTRVEFETLLQKLHKAVAPHWPDKHTGKPAKTDPGIVKTIHISTFGFSRGATQARAFINWLMSVCKLDAQLCGRSGMTLGGFEVQFDFLGLFDTVASVGLGNTMGNHFLGSQFDGHGAWADAEDSLRIPAGIRCVHLVAAHEIRRSFPLDSISVGGTLPANCDEIVVPGVHSDLGCGYCPLEQGRGTDPHGADMLSRIPLLYMYRQARLAGVPLKLELANDTAQQKFAVAPATIKALNDYLAVCTVRSGSLTAIMREQAKWRIRWNRTRRVTGKTPLEQSASFQRATTFDKNDLHSAALEFEQEIAAFDTWRQGKGKGFAAKSQPSGFDNEYENEWEEIATWWDHAPPPPAAAVDFFDNYVHDSRAWFKLGGDFPDNEADMQAKLRQWEARRKKIAEYNIREQKAAEENQQLMRRLYGKLGGVGLQPFTPLHDGLTDDQRRAALEFARTGKTPRMITSGREPFEYARGGYLRYRKVYAGGDHLLISQTAEPSARQAA